MPKASKTSAPQNVELDVEPGDAYYVVPGHLPVLSAGTEVVE